MGGVRRAAFDVLLQMEKENAYSNLTLDHTLGGNALSVRDRAFAARLVYGTTERKLTLDYILEQHLSQPIQKLKVQVLVNLRMAVYQLYFMDKVPDSAAINEAVTLTKETGCAFASGLVNAVLRKVAQRTVDLENAPEWVRYSCPEHLIRMWTKMYGAEHTNGILEQMNQPSDLQIRVNTLKTDAKSLCDCLEEEGVTAEVAWVDNAMCLQNVPGVATLSSFADGLFHVQDMASQLCVDALNPCPGETVFDLCAAPGGKAFTAAQKMENTGVLMAFDLYPHRLSLIEQGAQRLGISNVQTHVGDASVYDPSLGMADKVLCDVPCSGLGIVRKKPEIRYKELDSIKSLPHLQLQILNNAARYVKPGGTLVYSTCALNKKENNQVVAAFLAEHPAFTPVPFLPNIKRAVEDDGMFLTLLPHVHGTDGFFIAKLERSKGSET